MANEVKWTEEQKQAIYEKDSNILVAAAAGSGKTAVLVERILGLVLDENNPVDIDHLLIVTFTNAAAGEMRQRIGEAIEKRLLLDADNEHLQRQSTLLHRAQITTIDSFCLFVIKNNFNEIGLDPGFRVADTGEIELLKQDIINEMFEELNRLTHHYNNEIQGGKWQDFFNWQPYHWYRSQKIEQPVATPQLIQQANNSPQARFLSVNEALSEEGVLISSEADIEIPLWIEALTPIRNFSKAPEDNVFCKVKTSQDSYEASATPINNVWHAPYVGPMWSKVGTIHLTKGDNRLYIEGLKQDARIDNIFLGLYPPFVKEPRVRIPASLFDNKQGDIERIKGLGYTDGVLVQPFDTPSYQMENIMEAPYVEYELDLSDEDSTIEVRTLPTLRVYDGRDARYAVQLGDSEPVIFSIHTGDFTAEWRWNVLRGYASRTLPVSTPGPQKLRIYLLDPGIVLQEVLVHSQH